jgi:hypothetical protein
MYAVTGIDAGRWAGLRNKLLLLLPVIAMSLLYRVTGHLAQGADSVWIVKFALDDQIPFIRWFVYPYVYWYLYSYGAIGLLMLMRGAGRRYRRYVLSTALAYAAACVIFLIFPTYMPRPAVVEGSDLAAWLVRWLYRIDLPYNCLPSVHVAISVLTGWELELLLRQWQAWPTRLRLLRLALRAANAGSAILICLSTLLVKQHLSPDLIGGVIVAVAARWAVEGAMRRRELRHGGEKNGSALLKGTSGASGGPETN